MDNPVTHEDIRQAVKEGVEDAFTALGIDHASPLETQADFIYLRKLRKGRDALTSRVSLGIVGAVITAVTTLIVVGFNSMFGQN